MTYCILDAPLPVEGYVATLKLYPITVGDQTLGTWSAEFKEKKRARGGRGGCRSGWNVRQGVRGDE